MGRMSIFPRTYNNRAERNRKKQDTPYRIYQLAKAKGQFEVSLRYRDDWLRRRCDKLKEDGFLVGGRRQDRALIYRPAKDAPSPATLEGAPNDQA